MEELITELAEASAMLKEAVLNKADNLDEETKRNIELVKRVKMEVSVFAQIISGRFGNCNAKLACNIGNEPDRTFEMSLLAGEVLVHCPGWYREKEPGWKFLDEIILVDAKEIAVCLIEMNQREEDIRIELA
ncbi:MAG: hypothetical protein WC788_08745 [Candidatus Paceibacterota bacterium]